MTREAAKEEKTMMKVKTLMAAMQYSVDEAELYDTPDLRKLLSRMSPDTLRSEYGDRNVRQFWIAEVDGLVILEIVLK